MSKLPDFLLIGAMKAGTSTIYEQLRRQPGLFMSNPKEPNFFSDDDQFSRGVSWYRSLFSAARPSDLCGEASTHYTKLPTFPHTVTRMHALLPDVRLVYIIRHPIDRLVSHYIHAWSEAEISGSLESAVETNPTLIQYGLYSSQLLPFLETYGPDRILLVFFERMISSPEVTLDEILQHIGYRGQAKWFAENDRQNVSQFRLRKSAWRDRIVYAPILSSIRENFVPRTIREKVKAIWRLRRRPELSPEVREKLEVTFDDDLGTLGRWADLNLNCRSFKTVAAKSRVSWSTHVPGGNKSGITNR